MTLGFPPMTFAQAFAEWNAGWHRFGDKAFEHIHVHVRELDTAQWESNVQTAMQSWDEAWQKRSNGVRPAAMVFVIQRELAKAQHLMAFRDAVMKCLRVET